MNKRKRLRDLINAKEILVAPGAHDVLTAKIIKDAGFEAVYMTGYGQAASVLGGPDVGLLSMTEMVDRARKFVSAVDIPIIADGDTGFGNAINVMRTVQEYEQAGVAAVQLEDQVFPKKCGHMQGREVISIEDMVLKIKAAIEARTDEELVIIARTDARTNLGFDEALKRCKAYEAAGADVIFFESPENEEEMKKINEEIKVPTIANMVEGGRTPLCNSKELEGMGFNLVIFPTASVYVTTKSMINLMEEIKLKGTTSGYMEEMVVFEKFNDLMGLNQIRELESKFLVSK